jgi:23S rRNA (adenine-N6)-dimethyltransferase
MPSYRPNPSGVHFLSAPRVIRGLISSAGLRAGDLVIDFGAGPGTITGPLTETGSRVLAVERDESFVRQLTRRFGDNPLVRIVPGDVRTVTLPRKDFSVVASIPYAVSTPLLRRLLTAPHRALSGADLVVEWGFAKRVAAARTQETAWWATRFELRVAGRVPAACFRPVPRVDSAHLVIRRREDVHQRAIWALLDAAYRTPGQRVGRSLNHLVTHRQLKASTVDPSASAPEVPVRAWIELSKVVTHAPPLPKRLIR